MAGESLFQGLIVHTFIKQDRGDYREKEFLIDRLQHLLVLNEVQQSQEDGVEPIGGAQLDFLAQLFQQR